MSITQRKFARPEVQEKLTEKIDDAQLLGVEHIELQMVRSLLYRKVTVGVEELKIGYVKAGPGRDQAQLTKTILKAGELIFNPDQRGRCWGYLADTAANRMFLAETLREREKWFIIVDKDIRNDIFKLAMKEGINTIPIKRDPLNKMLAKKDPKVAQNIALEEQLALAKAEIVALKAGKSVETSQDEEQVEKESILVEEKKNLDAINAEMITKAEELLEARKVIAEEKLKLKKPLAGIHINKSKLQKKKISTDKVGL